MANLSVSIVRNCKTSDGWKRYPVVFSRNGRIRPGVVLVDGREQEFPVGRYQVRWYEGRKTAYKDVGDDPMKALKVLREKLRVLAQHQEAEDAPCTVIVPRSLMKRLEELAREEGVPTDTWVTALLAQRIGSIDGEWIRPPSR